MQWAPRLSVASRLYQARYALLHCPQVLGLGELGVHAAALTSLTSKDDAAAITKQVLAQGPLAGCWPAGG